MRYQVMKYRIIQHIFHNNLMKQKNVLALSSLAQIFQISF